MGNLLETVQGDRRIQVGMSKLNSHKSILVALGLALGAITCSGPDGTMGRIEPPAAPGQKAPGTKNTAVAIFAGGCFWCMEPPFEKTPGVVSVTSGYTGGTEKNPTYKQVSSGRTGHREAVKVIYDPAKVTYGKLLDVFWRQIDPSDAGGQFADRGPQYRAAIFVQDESERRQAEASRTALTASGRFRKPIVTEILPAGAFYAAEDYHQDYYKKNYKHYKAYRRGSGREGFLLRTWGDEKRSMKSQSEATTHTRPGADTRPARKYTKPDDTELRRRLTPLQYRVTQREGTERPFDNAYWNNHKAGIYVDIVSGEPLFSSLDKYDSKTGWPSFSRPLTPGNIVERVDHKLWPPRTEVRSKHGDSHLGHVFRDGPKPTGLRYCINSAALRFVPVEDLEKEGYGRFLARFKGRKGHKGH